MRFFEVYKPLTIFFFCVVYLSRSFFRLFFDFLIDFRVFGYLLLKKRDLGPKNEVLIEGKTSPQDHLRSIERNILSNLRALRGLNDALSVDNEALC